MVQHDNVISFEQGARAKVEARYAKLVEQNRRLVGDTLPKLLQGLFEKLDDALFDQAGKAPSATQNQFFDAMRLIRKQRDAVRNLYMELLLADFDAFWEGKPMQSLAQAAPAGISDSLDDDDESAFSLVDDAELEESLAVNNMISLGLNRYARELFALNHRFAEMRGGQELRDEENPVGPHVLCRCFHDALGGLEVETPVRLVIYKLFEHEVVRYVGAMYDDINALLREAGVLPKLPQRVKRNPVSPAIQRPASPAGPDEAAAGGSPLDDPYYDDSQQEQLFQTLQGLLASRRPSGYGGTGSGGAPRANLPRVDAGELMGALTALQQISVAQPVQDLDPTQIDLSDLRNQLNVQLKMVTEGEARRSLGQAEEDTIDVIAMLFEFILEERDLPDAMKALLSRLQIPMLKVAILDKRFFSQKSHPARRLLNALARAAVGWTDDGDRSANSFYGFVSGLVSRILSDFEDDVSLFDTLHEELDAFLSKEQRSAAVAEERTQQVTKGQEQLKLAKTRVAEEINRRVDAAGEVPQVVRDLLGEAWKDVLMLAYLREGEQSDKWNSGLQMVDRLLWSVSPKSDPLEKQKLLRAIPELLKDLRESLVAISFDQHKMARLFKELQAAHIACLRSATPAPAAAPVPAPLAKASAAGPVPPRLAEVAKKAEAEASEAPAAEASRPAPVVEEIVLASPADSGDSELDSDDEFVQMARELPVGTWMEWQQDEDTRVRGKLSWKSNVTDTYVFVSRKGTKLAEMSLRGVAALLRAERGRTLQQTDVPLMERALSAMVEALKKSKANERPGAGADNTPDSEPT